MSDEIRPSTPEDVPELARLLAEVFGAAPGATFAAPDVLAWKLFDPKGGPPDLPPGLVALRSGRVVGAVGIEPSVIVRVGPDDDPNADAGRREVPAIHPIDWVVSGQGVGVGGRLLKRVHRLSEVQYGIGLTPSSSAVTLRMGYGVRLHIPMWRRVFRPWARLGDRGVSPIRRGIGAAKDLAGMLRRGRRPRTPIELEPVDRFGPEVEAVAARLSAPMRFTRRDPERLNHLLRFPRPWFEGALVRQGGEIRGFLLLGVVPVGSMRVGRVVDCFLDAPDPDLWHSSLVAATEELRRRGADLAESFAPTPWHRDALRASGYRQAFEIPVYLRDPSGLVPLDVPFHLTQLEADYAYT